MLSKSLFRRLNLLQPCSRVPCLMLVKRTRARLLSRSGANLSASVARQYDMLAFLVSGESTTQSIEITQNAARKTPTPKTLVFPVDA